MNLEEISGAYKELEPYLVDPLPKETIYEYGVRIYLNIEKTPKQFDKVMVRLTGVSLSKLLEMPPKDVWELFLTALIETEILQFRSFIKEFER